MRVRYPREGERRARGVRNRDGIDDGEPARYCSARGTGCDARIEGFVNEHATCNSHGLIGMLATRTQDPTHLAPFALDVILRLSILGVNVVMI